MLNLSSCCSSYKFFPGQQWLSCWQSSGPSFMPSFYSTSQQYSIWLKCPLSLNSLFFRNDLALLLPHQLRFFFFLIQFKSFSIWALNAIVPVSLVKNPLPSLPSLLKYSHLFPKLKCYLYADVKIDLTQFLLWTQTWYFQVTI